MNLYHGGQVAITPLCVCAFSLNQYYPRAPCAMSTWTDCLIQLYSHKGIVRVVAVTRNICSMISASSVLLLIVVTGFSLLTVVSSEHHSSDRIGDRGKRTSDRTRTQDLRTLYCEVLATRAIDPSRDPSSPIALKYQLLLLIVVNHY